MGIAFRRAGAGALVIGPALLLADNLLHPREAPRGHESDQLAAIAAAYQRWQVAHLLGLAAVVVFAAAILGLAFLVSRRQPWLGLVGGALGIAGELGVAAALALDGYTWGQRDAFARQVLPLLLPCARQEGAKGLRTMTSRDRHRAVKAAARRRGGLHRAGGDRRVGQAIKARRDLATGRELGRWLSSREVGGTDPRFTYLADSHD
jgi:hypothetical protein